MILWWVRVLNDFEVNGTFEEHTGVIDIAHRLLVLLQVTGW
jgi:hypothetical protein